MKKYILIIALLFSALCLNVFAQTKSYPFEVSKTGKGKQAIIFISGFASSGDVWNETKANFEKDLHRFLRNDSLYLVFLRKNS